MFKNKSLFINNTWHTSSSKNFFEYKNLKKIRIRINNPKKDELYSLIDSSKAAQIFWKNKSNSEKSKILKIISNLITENKKSIALKEMFDTGKSYNQALDEIKYCHELWEHASKIVLNFREKTIRINKKTYCKIYNEPIGVTGIIVPWNFPFLVLSERLPYILASGCVGIIKPSEYASATLIKFMDLIKDNKKIPNGIINLVTGGAKIGSDLVKNKDIKCISFTGSSITGKNVMKKASTNLKRLSLELGGKNPIIVFKDADLKKTIKNIIISFTHNSGQCCVGASRIFVEKKIFKKFQRLFKEELEKNNKFYQISNFMQYEKIFKYLNKKNFLQKIFYGEIPKKKNKKLQIKPIVFKNLSKQNDIHKTELFGPIITLESYEKNEELKKLIDESNYGLACMIWTKNIKEAQKFIKGIQIGRLWINGNIKQNYPNIPIGGFKWSGLGRETGDMALENYSEKKSIIINI